MNFLNKKNDNITTANVVDNHLILSIPNAKTPVLWRMELKKTGAASFEVKEDKDGSYILVVKLTKTTSETIAPFDEKQDAVDALMAASNALQNAPASTTTVSVDSNAKPTKITKKSVKNTAKATNDNKAGSTWLIIILGTAITIGLFTYLLSLAPQDTTLNAQTISSIQNASPQTATGVPVSADDFLNGL